MDMPNVLIRDVPAEDLDQIRAAAAQQGTSLQGYLLDAVHAQASYLRRQAALAGTGERLKGRAAVPEGEREAVLAAIQDDIEERGDQLSRRHT